MRGTSTPKCCARWIVSILTSPAVQFPCLAVRSTSATEGSQWHEAVLAPQPLHGMSTTRCQKGSSSSDAHGVRMPRAPAMSTRPVSIARSSPRALSSVPPRLAVSALDVHADDQLAEVASLQHADKGCGRLLQTVDEVLAVADTAVGDAGTDLAQEGGIVLGGTFGVDEAAHRQALRQDLAHGGGQPVGAVALAHAVVLRDQATDRDAREFVEQRQHRLPDRSTDILEVHVDPVWASRRQLGWKIGRAVINRRVEAEFVFHISTFLRPAGNADRSR